METVKTFVFVDLETTGLPHCGVSRITEISLVAAEREHILNQDYGVAKENIMEHCYLPRVLNKISFTIYPCKMIHPAASEISGLTNDILERQKPFDDNMFNILQLFMDRLEKPVCLIAHNGNKCDFPILKSELTNIQKEFSEDVYCVDSLLAFREVLTAETKCEDIRSNKNDVLSGITPINPPTNRAADLVPKCGFSQEDYDQELIKTLEVSEKIVQEYDHFNAKEIEIRIKSEMDKLRKENESTPVRKPKLAVGPKGDNVRRNLNDTKKPREKFNLSALYERVTKKKLKNAHRAENDALALLECVAVIGLPIVQWMDAYKIPFRDIKRIW